MSKVTLKKGETQQQLMRRFKKKVIASKVLGEVRKRRWFVSRTEQRREDKKSAIRRAKKVSSENK